MIKLTRPTGDAPAWANENLISVLSVEHASEYATAELKQITRVTVGNMSILVRETPEQIAAMCEPMPPISPINYGG